MREINEIQDNESICYYCRKKIDDDKNETVFDDDCTPYCKGVLYKDGGSIP